MMLNPALVVPQARCGRDGARLARVMLDVI
jgi:hypothetical protein